MFAWGGIEKTLRWLVTAPGRKLIMYTSAEGKGNKQTAELTDIGILLLTTFCFMAALFSALWFCVYSF